jgi:hypothetical protein
VNGEWQQPFLYDVNIVLFTDVMCLDAAEAGHALFQRVGLLQARLIAEAEDPAAIWGAGYSDGRYAKELTARSVFGALHGKTAEQLDLDDALSYACAGLIMVGFGPCGVTRAVTAAGYTVPEFMGIVVAEVPMLSKKRCPTDEKPIRMLTLLVELLRSGEHSDLVLDGALYGVFWCCDSRPAVASVAVELGIFELAAARLSRAGSPSDWLSKAWNAASTGGSCLFVTSVVASIV